MRDRMPRENHPARLLSFIRVPLRFGKKRPYLRGQLAPGAVWMKERLKRRWIGEEVIAKVDLAAYFYFNHNTSYGPHFLG